MVQKLPPITRTRSEVRVTNFNLDRVDPDTLTMTHLCAAVDALPGVRLGTRGLRADEAQLCVEVYDPAVDAWRTVLTFSEGRASVEQQELKDRRGAAYRAMAQLARLLDACFVTEEGVVLVWGGGWEEAA